MKSIARLFSSALLIFTITNIQAEAAFEIVNEGDKPIYLALENDLKPVLAQGSQTYSKTLAPGEKFSTELTTHDEMVICINTDAPITLMNIGKTDYRFELADSSNDKTKYLIWNPKKSPKSPLHPQTKTKKYLGFIKGKSKGFANNITQKEIVRVASNK